jgi:hypothetical protein
VANLNEVLAKSNITTDTKARRVLNTAPDKIAGITLEEIEAGVTIERLESLSVPVYQYGGQITIHGTFQDIPSDLRVAGYKSVFLNGNGSLGVRYVAIDAEKKDLLLEASQYVNSETRLWSIFKDSTGYVAQKLFKVKQDAIDRYNSTPDSLYIGSKQAYAHPYGYYVVEIAIGAIYQANVWPLIAALTGIKSQAELDTLKHERELKYALEAKERETKQAEYNHQQDAKRQAAIASFTPPANWKAFNGSVVRSGLYAKVGIGLNGPALFVTDAKKYGTKFMTKSKAFYDFNYQPFKVTHGRMLRDSLTINGWLIEYK